MSTAHEQFPAAEAGLRQDRCRALLDARLPGTGGLLLFSPVALYYLTGTLTAGVLWLPLAGEPVLLARRALERARAESPLRHILPYRTYGELAALCAEAGSPLTPVVAAEKGGLGWAAAETLQARLRVRFEDAAEVLSRARAVKTPYELIRMREAGARHRASYDAMTKFLRPGLTEHEIAVILWKEFMAREHAMVTRSVNLTGEAPLGHIATGNNANYPDAWGGTVGGPGEHPAAPYLGDPGAIWIRHSLLMVDMCFNYQGYHTDVSQVFWSGPAAAVPDAVRRAHEVCVDIHERAAGLLRPGNTPEQIWTACAALAKEAGFADNYMGLGENRARFLGHGVGLAYDEYPALAPRFGEQLEPGMTLAVEPKIGLPGLGRVGLENVFEITEDGARSLTGYERSIVCVEG